MSARKAQIIDTAESREEAWDKAREYVEILNQHGLASKHQLICVIRLSDTAFWVKAVPARAEHITDLAPA